MAAKVRTVQVLAISGVQNRSTQLAPGFKYALRPSADCWYRQGASNVAAQVDTPDNFFLNKGATDELIVSDATDSFISVIGASGSLCIARLEGA